MTIKSYNFWQTNPYPAYYCGNDKAFKDYFDPLERDVVVKKKVSKVPEVPFSLEVENPTKVPCIKKVKWWESSLWKPSSEESDGEESDTESEYSISSEVRDVIVDLQNGVPEELVCRTGTPDQHKMIVGRISKIGDSCIKPSVKVFKTPDTRKLETVTTPTKRGTQTKQIVIDDWMYRSIATEELDFLQQILDTGKFKLQDPRVGVVIDFPKPIKGPAKPQALRVVDVCKEKTFQPTEEGLAFLDKIKDLIPEANKTVETTFSMISMLDDSRDVTKKFELSFKFAQHWGKTSYSLQDHLARVAEIKSAIKRSFLQSQSLEFQNAARSKYGIEGALECYKAQGGSPLVQCAALSKFGIGESGEPTAYACFRGARFSNVGFFGIRTTPSTKNYTHSPHAFAVFIESELDADKFFKWSRYDTFEEFLSKLPPKAVIFDPCLRFACFPYEFMQKGKIFLEYIRKFSLDQVVLLDTLKEDSEEIFVKEQEVDSLVEKTMKALNTPAIPDTDKRQVKSKGKTSVKVPETPETVVDKNVKVLKASLTFEVSPFWYNYMKATENEFRSLWDSTFGSNWEAVRIINDNNRIIMRIILPNLEMNALVSALITHGINYVSQRESSSHWRIDVPDTAISSIRKVKEDASRLRQISAV